MPCHFVSHFICPHDVKLEEEDFESHPKDVIPHDFAERGAFWWYAHVTHFLLQENTDFRLKITAAKAALGYSIYLLFTGTKVQILTQKALLDFGAQ